MIKLLLMSHMDFMRDFSFHKLGQHLGWSSCPLFSEHLLRVCCFIFISTFGGLPAGIQFPQILQSFLRLSLALAYSGHMLLSIFPSFSERKPVPCLSHEHVLTRKGGVLSGPYICYPQTCTFVLATIGPSLCL